MAASFVVGLAPIEAVARVAHHYPVFPCRSRPEEIDWRGKRTLMRAKTPLVARGFHEATQDLERVRAWWARWPDALAGVPTGADTGLIVVDYDAQKADAAAQAWIAEHTDVLLATRSHTTLSGGRHYLFRAPPGVRYRSGASLILGGEKRIGIDLRAEGGYIIWWPLHGGSISGEIAPLPAGLIDERRIEPQPVRALPSSSPAQWQRDRQRVADALAWLEPDDYDRWIRCGMALHRASGGSDTGFGLWHDWSAGGITGTLPANYGGIVDCQYRWASFSSDGNGSRPIGLGSIFAEAKAAGWRPQEVPRETPPPTAEPPPLEEIPIDTYVEDERAAIMAESAHAPRKPRQEAAAPPKPSRQPVIDWAALEGQTPPERAWIIPHWVPAGHMTLLSGRGGVGKSLMAQHLGSAIALGVHYLEPIEPRRVLMWASEDDAAELWRRQVAISRWMDAPLSALAERFFVRSYVGTDVTLMAPVYGELIYTPMLTELREQVAETQAEVVILDNIARLFGGNENDRHAVTTFCAFIQGACTPAAVILLGHPAKAQGSEYSGSTAWEGAVRARLYLGDRPPDQEPSAEDEPIDEDVRYLCRRKANYSALDLRKFTLSDGVLVPEAPERPVGFGSSGTGEFTKDVVRRAIRKLAAVQVYGNSSTASPAYLPKLAKQYKLLEATAEKAFATAMREMILSQELVTKPVGRGADRHLKLGLVLASDEAR